MDAEEELEEGEAQLVAKRNATSVIWRYFGFRYDDTEQQDVLCKTYAKLKSLRPAAIRQIYINT